MAPLTSSATKRTTKTNFFSFFLCSLQLLHKTSITRPWCWTATTSPRWARICKALNESLLLLLQNCRHFTNSSLMHEEKWRQNRKRNKEKEREKNSQEPQQKNVQLMILPTTTTTITIPHLLLLLLPPPPSFAMRLAQPFGTALLSFPPEIKIRALIRISSPFSLQRFGQTKIKKIFQKQVDHQIHETNKPTNQPTLLETLKTHHYHNNSNSNCLLRRSSEHTKEKHCEKDWQSQESGRRSSKIPATWEFLSCNLQSFKLQVLIIHRQSLQRRSLKD